MTNNYPICHVLTPSETSTRFICHALTPPELLVNIYNEVCGIFVSTKYTLDLRFIVCFNFYLHG